MQNNTGGFVGAALPSIVDHFEMLLKHFPDYATSEQINTFLLNNVDKFLSSIGVAFSRQSKMDEKLLDKYVVNLDRMYQREYLKDCNIVIDSAGYQCQCFMSMEQIVPFVDLYYKYFIVNNHHKFDKAFTLDLAPGFSHCPYKSWKELEELNIRSYENAVNLPDEIRDKICYIHHFRTPKLYAIYKKMFREYGFAKKFKHFGTGGLVSFSNAKNAPPCVMYSVPLLDVIKHALDDGLTDISFHALGETEFKSILTHCFFERHIKEKYGINLTITFDSSTIFKVLALGRYTYVLDNDMIWKIGLRSDIMDNSWRGGISNAQFFYNIINNAIAPHGLKTVSLDTEPMYVDGKFNKLFYAFGILQMFNLFKTVQDLCYKIVDELYPIYQSNDEMLFTQRIGDIMINFNNGVATKTLDIRTNSLYNSLKMLETLDFDYADHLVNHYMCTEEKGDLPDK